MDADTIIPKIKKLLALAKSDNEHEAATAAARAVELMARYEIEEASLRVEDAKPAEPIGEETIENSKRYVAWKGTLASGLATAFGARMFWWTKRSAWQGQVGTDIVIFGRKSAIATVRYMFAYLTREVERLADEAWDRSDKVRPVSRWNYELDQAVVESVPDSPRSWKHAFRVGAAHTIAERLRSQRAEEQARRKAAVVNEEAPPVNTKALVLINREEEEVEEAYEKRSESFTHRHRGSRVANNDGYSAGCSAGSKVNLGGGRALKAAPGKLRGDR